MLEIPPDVSVWNFGSHAAVWRGPAVPGLPLDTAAPKVRVAWGSEPVREKEVRLVGPGDGV